MDESRRQAAERRQSLAPGVASEASGTRNFFALNPVARFSGRKKTSPTFGRWSLIRSLPLPVLTLPRELLLYRLADKLPVRVLSSEFRDRDLHYCTHVFH